MKNCLTLLAALLVLAAPAHAGETQDQLAKRVSFPVPEGLCAMPENDTGKSIFARLDQVQRDIGNLLIAMFPTCEDAKTIEAGNQPLFSHYAMVATIAKAVNERIDVGREQIIAETSAQLQQGNSEELRQMVMESARDSLKELGVRNIELSQPVSYIGQDDMAVYGLLRQRLSTTDKNSLEVMGVLSATGINGVPVFVYYYDAPPDKESSVKLYDANRAYLSALDNQNMLP